MFTKLVVFSGNTIKSADLWPVKHSAVPVMVSHILLVIFSGRTQLNLQSCIKVHDRGTQPHSPAFIPLAECWLQSLVDHCAQAGSLIKSKLSRADWDFQVCGTITTSPGGWWVSLKLFWLVVFFLPFLCWGYFHPKHVAAKSLENHLNPVMLVFIRWLSLSHLRWVPMCQGFSNF